MPGLTVAPRGSKDFLLIHPADGSLSPYGTLWRGAAEAGPLPSGGIANELHPAGGGPVIPIASLVAEYGRLISNSGVRPDVLCGWSFGGNVAAELSRELRKAGQPDLVTVLIDSWAQYSEQFREWDYFLRQVRSTKGEEFVRKAPAEWLRGLYGRGQSLLDHTAGPLEGRVLLVRAARPSMGYEASPPRNGWTVARPENLKVVEVDATHDGILSDPHVPQIAREIMEFVR